MNPFQKIDETILQEIAELNFDGNIIPMKWFGRITFSNGKPDTNAILILSDIVYWYRPILLREEQTGKILGYQKKFKADFLQKNYQNYADLFGLSKRQVIDAFGRLEKIGVIKREFRSITMDFGTLPNVMFIALNISVLKDLMKIGVLLEEQFIPGKEKWGIPRFNGGPLSIERETNTKNTTEITTKKNANARSQGENSLSKEMIIIWNQTVGKATALVASLDRERASLLSKTLKIQFEGCLNLWRSYCKRIESSSFLTGQGMRGWIVSLDWALKPKNIRKIREGNFDDLKIIPKNTIPLSEEINTKENSLSLEDGNFREALLTRIGGASFKSWFTDCHFLGAKEGKAFLKVPKAYMVTLIPQKFSQDIMGVLQTLSKKIESFECIPISCSKPKILFQNSLFSREIQKEKYS